MLKRIKDINEALPGMLLIECIYLVVAQIIIFIAVPNKIMCAVGLLVGVIYAVFSSFHLSFNILPSLFTIPCGCSDARILSSTSAPAL